MWNFRLLNVIVIIQIVLKIVIADTLMLKALEKINSIRRNGGEDNGVAPLTGSEKLSKIGYNKEEGKWNISSNEKAKQLFSTIKKCNAETVEDALKQTITKFSAYLGLPTQFPDLIWNKTIELSKPGMDNVFYEMADLIEEGNQAQVFLGRKKLGKNGLVAIKYGIKGKLESEVNCYKAITPHRNLIQLIDYGDEPGTSESALVLELLTADVYQFVNVCGHKLSLKTSILLVKEMLKAVKHVNENGFVHRDVKLENFLLVRSEGKTYIKIGDLGSAEKYSENNSGSFIGTCYTMSVFTMRGESPRPRDDVMSIWFLLTQLVQGSLQWQFPCMYNLRQREVYDLKLLYGKQLAEKYDELKEFSSHIFDIKLDDTPNYKLFDDSLVELMKHHEIEDDGIFDWDESLHMLLKDHDVLKLGIEHKEIYDTYELVFQFEKFYASLLTEMEKHCRIIEVLDCLSRDARSLASSQHEQHDVPAFFKLRVHEDGIEDIKLTDFENYDALMILLKMNSILRVGFGYFYDSASKSFTVTVLLKMLSLGNPRLPQTAEMSEKAAVLLRKYLEHNLCWENSTLQNTVVYHQSVECSSRKLLFDKISEALGTLPDYITQMIYNSYLLEYGFAWKEEKVCAGCFKITIVYTFLQNVNFSATLALQCAAQNPSKLSWTVDESNIENSNTTLTHPSSSSSSSRRPTSLKPKEAWVESREIRVATNLEANAADQIATILQNFGIVDRISNLRIHWKPSNDGSRFIVLLLMDTYFTLAKTTYVDNALQNRELQPYQDNWELTESDPKLNQLANDLARQNNFDEGITKAGLPQGNGLIVYATKIIGNTYAYVDEGIISSVEFLTKATSNQDLLQVHPHDVSAISFGYTITSEASIKSVVIFETYCREALGLVNDERRKLQLNNLILHENNYADAKIYRKNYVGTGSLLQSMSCISPASSSEIRKPLEMKDFNGETRKEALSSFVVQLLAKGKGTNYDLVTSKDKTEISFIIFQSTEGGKWKIDFKLY